MQRYPPASNSASVSANRRARVAVGHAEGSQIVLGKLSGRAGFAARASALGFTMPGTVLARAFERFQTIADRVAVVGDEDVARICRDVLEIETDRF